MALAQADDDRQDAQLSVEKRRKIWAQLDDDKQEDDDLLYNGHF